MKKHSALRTSTGAVLALLLVLVHESGFSQMPQPTPIAAPAEPNAIPLYSGNPPPAVPSAETWATINGNDRTVRNVTRPTLTLFLPDPAKATGAAVIVAPGGAFLMLSMDSEGWAVSRWLADHGIAAFVLKYRLEPTPADQAQFVAVTSARFRGLTSGGSNPALSVYPEAIADGKAAVKMIRERSAEWKIDPHRIGMVGFSAGAMTTLQTSLDKDPAALPDFIGLIYGPMNAIEVPASAPPLFAAIAADDPLFGKGGYGLINAWRKAGKPTELHVYEKGGHGFGMRQQGTTSDLWINQFYAWMKMRGLLERVQP